MHEIITLQFGQAANFVGTHFWNAQETYFTYDGQDESLVDHDVHWRGGEGAHGEETFTPRVLIYDLRGGFGSMKKINEMYEAYEEKDPLSLWGGQQSSYIHEQVPKNQYQQHLDSGAPADLEKQLLSTETVKVWSDFNRIYYHPRSLKQLNGYDADGGIDPFDSYLKGKELYEKLEHDHGVFDSDFRPLLEEADQLQGVNVLTGTRDGWGGFSASYLEILRDEMPKMTIHTYGLEGPESSEADKHDIKKLQPEYSFTQAFNSIHETSTLYTPLTLPLSTPRHLNGFNLQSQWHTSALLALAIENITLPTRLRRETAVLRMTGLAARANWRGQQKINQLELYAPLQQAAEVDRRNILRWGWASADIPGESTFGTMAVFRGVDGETAADELMQSLETRTAPLTNKLIQKTQSPLPDSFPYLFDKVDGVATYTSLKTSTLARHRLKSMVGVVKMCMPRGDDRDEMVNGLEDIREAYELEDEDDYQ
ncbi:hypothetical protein G7K_5302-t1 [Saitoella complicata NRRL Y-17804]|uniref:Tubulin nucleotide-binding domain-like protein n=2 Tax=Saitoella complicata (strain BCRC 22490 / CBS 7301 / JCM 7358 / NBRC 10748 / NRRL Y-17804) TaxID=698492 RepID=A0A0E9NNC1_SAICN|nr:hypothetical protein G7K_5302-t1 [Saitoella complicata NRRL Y-17804]